MKGIMLSFLLGVCVAMPLVSQGDSIGVVETTAEAVFWLGGPEAVEALAEVVFALGPETPVGPVEPEPGPGTVVWDVGENATAFLQDGVLYVRGEGAVTSAPWSGEAASVAQLKIAAEITSLPEGALEGMDNLTQVNGLSLSVFNGVAVGVVKAGGFTAIMIDPATRTGTVTFRVKKATSVEAPEDEWTAVEATGVKAGDSDARDICVPISAESPAGFFKVLSD